MHNAREYYLAAYIISSVSYSLSWIIGRIWHGGKGTYWTTWPDIDPEEPAKESDHRRRAKERLTQGEPNSFRPQAAASPKEVKHKNPLRQQMPHGGK